VAEAERMLGRPFDLSGPVVHGDERGRTLGFPTANLVPVPGFTVPGHGVYACLVQVGPPGGAWVPAATNIGVRPTFQTGRGELIEAFLIDWEGDLYDRVIRIAFLERLRGERRFASADALVEQMRADVRDALATVSSRT
jgi:riboflavin kinase/FMN adenylyltransferase